MSVSGSISSFGRGLGPRFFRPCTEASSTAACDETMPQRKRRTTEKRMARWTVLGHRSRLLAYQEEGCNDGSATVL